MKYVLKESYNDYLTIFEMETDAILFIWFLTGVPDKDVTVPFASIYQMSPDQNVY